MNLAFDLTTPEGRKNAIDAFDKYGWILAWPAWLIRQAYKDRRRYCFDRSTKECCG